MDKEDILPRRCRAAAEEAGRAVDMRPACHFWLW